MFQAEAMDILAELEPYLNSVYEGTDAAFLHKHLAEQTQMQMQKKKAWTKYFLKHMKVRLKEQKLQLIDETILKCLYLTSFHNNWLQQPFSLGFCLFLKLFGVLSCEPVGPLFMFARFLADRIPLPYDRSFFKYVCVGTHSYSTRLRLVGFALNHSRVGASQSDVRHTSGPFVRQIQG